MIYFDVTKTGSAGHRSGLMRVSTRLREALGPAATEVTWSDGAFSFAKRSGQPAFAAGDWFFTSELFSEEERPGFSAFVANRPCQLAAVFHDAIPLKLPHITWPQSVARHPGYMKLLASFDRVWAVSRTSRTDLTGFWAWQRVAGKAAVEVLHLGADLANQPRVTTNSPVRLPGAPRVRLLCIGIIEPRKNQSFLLEVCDDLWREKLDFELHVVGRVNPHFGQGIVERLKMLQRTHGDKLQFHEAADDATLTRLYASAHATVYPTIAEGCGLPLLESLWWAVPCVCSDLPVLRENADEGGCLCVPVGDVAGWKAALRRIVSEDAFQFMLRRQAVARLLPTWAEAAGTLRRALS